MSDSSPADTGTDTRGVSRLRDDGPEYETVSVPVLVVGTGSAGARTAIELAERGVEPLDDGYELDYDHLE